MSRRRHVSQRCFFEGCGAPGPFGVRFPGPLSKVPEKYRGYLWHCADHREAAVARRDRALEKARAEGLIEAEQLDMSAWLRDAG